MLSVGVFTLYAALASRDVMFGDARELVASAAHNGVAHPPGYPLWIVLAHLATLVPIGPLPYRVNLTASVFHAVTVGLVYAAGYVLVRHHGPALFAAVLLAIASPLFVTWSLQAEVFSLNDLFAAAIVLLCLLWLADPRHWRLVVPIAVLFGLGLANHQTLILLAPLPLWAAWCGRDAIRSAGDVPQTLGLAALLLLLAFWLPYLHTILASQRLEEWQLGETRTFSELIDVIDRRVFGTFNLVPGAADRGGTFADRVVAMVGAGGWPYAAIAVGLLGLGLRRRHRKLILAALIVAIPLLAFCFVANINVRDETLRAIFQRFGLLPLTALAPFAACAVPVLERLVERRRAMVVAVDVALRVFLALTGLALPRLSLASVHDPRTLCRDISRALPANAILMTAGDAVDQTFVYFQSLEGWRPDVTVVTFGLLDLAAYRSALAKTIDVPPEVGADLAPQARRDILVRANANRPFYTVGERGIHAPGPLYYPSVSGIVSRMIARSERVYVLRRYREEVVLQSLPGYAAISPNRWLSNGFGSDVRAYYAAGFFSTGADAERLGDPPAAITWYERARAYSPDPLIEAQLERLRARR